MLIFIPIYKTFFYWRSFLRKKKIHDKVKYVFYFLNGSLNYICFYNHRFLCFSLYIEHRLHVLMKWIIDPPSCLSPRPQSLLRFPGVSCTSLCVLHHSEHKETGKSSALYSDWFFFYQSVFSNSYFCVVYKTCLMHDAFIATIMNIWKRFAYILQIIFIIIHI